MVKDEKEPRPHRAGRTNPCTEYDAAGRAVEDHLRAQSEHHLKIYDGDGRVTAVTGSTRSHYAH